MKYGVGERVFVWNYRKTKKYYEGEIGKVLPSHCSYRYRVVVTRNYTGTPVAQLPSYGLGLVFVNAARLTRRR